MALTDTRPDVTGSPSGASAAMPSGTLEGFLGAVDHKPVGRMFMGGGTLFLVASLVVAVVAAFESADGSGFQVVGDADEFAQVWSISRDLMIFGGLVPLLIGIGLYIVPLQIGAPSLAFARGASGAFWTWLLGSGLLVIAYLLNGGPGGGRRDFIVLWACALAMMIGAAVWAFVVLASTILGARTVGMTMDRVPFTTWGFFVFALLGLFSLPIVMAELLLVLLRVRYLHMPIDDSEALTAVMDGVSFAPSVYWLGIPGLGIAADVIGAHTGVPVRLRRSVMIALTAFGLLSFGQDLVGLGTARTIDFDNALLVLGLLAAVVPVLAVLGMCGDSLRRGTFKPRSALLAALLSGLLMLAGALVSLLGLVEPIMGFLDELFPDSIDMTNSLVLNGTTFHEGIRALVVGAAVLAVIAAVHHWATKFWGRSLPEPMGMLSIFLAATGAAIWAFGEVAAGFADQPFYPTVAETDDSLQAFGFIATVGVALLAGAAAVLGANMASVALSRKPVGSSPEAWTGSTLEWATASPPPVGNFPAPPIVTSATPLEDGELAYDGLSLATADDEGSDSVGGEGEGEES